MIVDPPAPRSVLVVAAHPDDLEFSAGGTIARWTAAGTTAFLCVCTKGEKGTKNRDVASETLARTRMDEQREGARELGVSEVVFLSYPDGELTPSLELRTDVVRLIRRFRPSAAMCPDPTRRFTARAVNHPDHLAAGEATLQAVYPTARDRAALPELLAQGLEPHVVREVFLYAPREATCLVDVSTTLEAKIVALSAHRSQIDEASARELVLAASARCGAPHGVEHAESFDLVTIE